MEDVSHSSHPDKTWKGFRLCAIDGTVIRLPNEPDIVEHFGVQKGKTNQEDCAMGMASVFYDVLNHRTLDAHIGPKGTSERHCAAEHVCYAGKNDLVLYDRGYCAFWLYALPIKHTISFCMRATTHRDLIVQAFIESNKKESVVTFTPNKISIQACKERGLPTTPVTLRLVRVTLPGEVEVLITNVLDVTTLGAKHFKSLYHQRWGIEEHYKRLKQWVEIENFSGKSALSVQQDFHAKILAMNITALMAMAAQRTNASKSQHHRLHYAINFAQALSKMKHRIVRFIQHAHCDISAFIMRTIHYMSKTVEAVRRGRSAPRRLKNAKNDIHYAAYKSTL